MGKTQEMEGLGFVDDTTKFQKFTFIIIVVVSIRKTKQNKKQDDFEEKSKIISFQKKKSNR